MKYDELIQLKNEHKLTNIQGKCPHCGKLIETYGSIEFEGDMVYFPWHCEYCNIDGEEWYELKFQGHNIYDDEGNQIEL